MFVERSRRAIEENLRATGLADRAEVVREDIFKFLAWKPAERFDIVYIAPPQYRGLWARTLQALDERDILAEDGLTIAQIYPKEYQDLELKNLRLIEQRRYGSTMLCFYASGQK